MPQPRISSQSSPSPKRISPLSRRHWMSTSSDGSVNGKERRAKAHADLVDLEEGLAELGQNPFQMAEMRFLVDHQAFDLMEHRRMRLVAVAAIGAARRDDADRRLLRQHGAHLHRRGVGAQQEARAVRLRIEEERVVHLARRMRFRDIELGEVVIVGLDIGPFGDSKAHIGENRGQFVDHLGDRMDAADLERRLAHRQRDVDALGVEARLQRCVLERVAARRRARR